MSNTDLSLLLKDPPPALQGKRARIALWRLVRRFSVWAWSKDIQDRWDDFRQYQRDSQKEIDAHRAEQTRLSKLAQRYGEALGRIARMKNGNIIGAQDIACTALRTDTLPDKWWEQNTPNNQDDTRSPKHR